MSNPRNVEQQHGLGVDLPHGVDDSAGEKVANWGLPAFGWEWLDLDHLVHGHADDPILVLDRA